MLKVGSFKFKQIQNKLELCLFMLLKKIELELERFSKLTKTNLSWNLTEAHNSQGGNRAY